MRGYKTIKDYVNRSSTWRDDNLPIQLFLSHTNSHRPVSSDALARWLKETLWNSGVNLVGIFCCFFILLDLLCHEY